MSVLFWVHRNFRRHNSSLQTLGFDMHANPISDPIRKSVGLELVLCQLRNVHVTEIHASNKCFDGADATRIAEALRCEHPARTHAWTCIALS